MTEPLTESHLKEEALDWLSELGFGYKFGPDIPPEMPEAKRKNFGATASKIVIEHDRHPEAVNESERAQ